MRAADSPLAKAVCGPHEEGDERTGDSFPFGKESPRVDAHHAHDSTAGSFLEASRALHLSANPTDRLAKLWFSKVSGR